MLYNKWWSKEQSGAECPRGLMEDISKASALNIVNIGGVFVVLLCGLAVAVLESLFCFRILNRLVMVLMMVLTTLLGYLRCWDQGE